MRAIAAACLLASFHVTLGCTAQPTPSDALRSHALTAPAPAPSGGLGLARNIWAAQRGLPTLPQSGVLYSYRGGDTEVISTLDGDWIIYAKRTWRDADAPSIDAARAEAVSLTPDDGRLVRAFPATIYAAGLDPYIKEVYLSDWLADQWQTLGNPYWPGDQPGGYNIVLRTPARLGGRRVTEYSVSLGNAAYPGWLPERPP